MLFVGGDLISQTLTKDNNWSPVTADAQTKNPTATYSIAFNFRCDSSVDGVTIQDWSFDDTTFRYTINIVSSSGKYLQLFLKITLVSACALLSIDQVSKFISDNPIPFTIVGAVIGLAVAVLGLKLFLPTLFITGFASGFFIALVIRTPAI